MSKEKVKVDGVSVGPGSRLSKLVKRNITCKMEPNESGWGKEAIAEWEAKWDKNFAEGEAESQPKA